MPSKAIRIQELRRVPASPVVMVAVFITSFCRQKPRGKSDWLQTERQRGRERGLVSEGEDILAQRRGEMPTRCRGRALDKCQCGLFMIRFCFFPGLRCAHISRENLSL